MNNINLKSYVPHENVFKFKCVKCGTYDMDIMPIGIPYYKTHINFNPFITEGQPPLPLVTAIKKSNECICECRKCNSFFIVSYNEDLLTYLREWIKFNKVEEYSIFNNKITGLYQ